jgi:hypothetical protein
VRRVAVLALGALYGWLAASAIAQNGLAIHAGALPDDIEIAPPVGGPDLSAPWLDTDIGAPLTAGAASDAANVLTISGQGDINNASDTGHLVYQEISGDRSVATDLTALTGDIVWRRTGPIARDEDGEAQSRYCFTSVDGRSPSTGVRFSWKAQPADVDSFVDTLPAVTLPIPLKTEVNGGVCTGYRDDDRDGVWTVVGTAAIPFSGSIYYGAAVSSGSLVASGVATATMSLPVIATVSAAETGTTQFTSASQSVDENAGTVTITVNRGVGTAGAASVQVANAGTGSAVAGTDFTDPGFPVTRSWTDGEGGDKTIVVSVTNRVGTQANRDLDLELTSAMGAGEGTINTHTIDIVDVAVATDEELTQGTTNYFVAPGVSGASNSCNGRYQTNQGGSNCPWATIAAVDAKSFATNEDVWFLAGTTVGTGIILNNATMEGALSGASCTQRFIVGSYYNDGGTPRRGFGGSARPVIRGTATYYDHDGSGSITKFPTDDYSALIYFGDGATCYRIENLNIINSGGRAIEARGENLEIVDNRIERIWLQTIQLYQSTDALVEGNELVGGNFRYHIVGSAGGAWGGSLQIVKSSGFTIRDNVVREGWGEGINGFTLSSPINSQGTIEGNFVLDTRSVAIYIDGDERMVVRNNVLAHTGRTNYLRGTVRNFGISVGDEGVTVDGDTRDVVVYNNIMAGVNACLNIHNSADVAHSNIYFYSNACIDTPTNIGEWRSPMTGCGRTCSTRSTPPARFLRRARTRAAARTRTTSPTAILAADSATRRTSTRERRSRR